MTVYPFFDSYGRTTNITQLAVWVIVSRNKGRSNGQWWFVFKNEESSQSTVFVMNKTKTDVREEILKGSHIEKINFFKEVTPRERTYELRDQGKK